MTRRICLAIPQPLHRSGGVEVLVRELARGLGDRYSINLASMDETSTILDSFPGLAPPGHFRVEQNQTKQWTASFVRWLQHQNVELVHFHSPGSFGWSAGSFGRSPMLAVAKAGIPFINTNHQVITPWDLNRRETPLIRRIVAFAKRWPGKTRLLHRGCHEVCVSEHDLHWTRRLFPTAASKTIRIYHSRITLDSHAPDLPESRQIVSLAAVCNRKGQSILVEAFLRLVDQFPDWTLHLVGPLMEKTVVEAIRHRIDSSDHSERIFMDGPTDQAMERLRNAEIYVQPSLLEGLGLSIQEAMSQARPCIGSKVGGIPELIDDGETGFLVSPGNVDQLADALAKLMEDREIRRSLGKAGWASLRSKEMTFDRMINRYDRLYQEVLAH